MTDNIAIYWFRQDLRLSDNPALVKAAQSGKILPVYILDDKARRMQSASDWWLYHALHKLNQALNGHLHIYSGDPQDILLRLIKKTRATRLFWSRLYTPYEMERDARIKSTLQADGIHVTSENGSLLWEPWECLKDDGTPYKVFTPFYKRCLASPVQPRAPLATPKIECISLSGSLKIDALNLLPKIRWDRKLESHWNIGEKAAQEKLQKFLKNKITAYKEERDFPAIHATSKLSPHLHFGEISPQQIWHAARRLPASTGRDHFLSELGWREFGTLLLYHFPETRTKSLNSKFDHFPWITDDENLKAWQKGQTGIPIIDAGMRELWETGMMHNRIRMITASFLVKNLMIHWRMGEHWFYDCLVDADMANNVAGWQWVAGSGADAAPYFRIFNPVTQAKKFDPEGVYIKRFVPELAGLDPKHVHAPWEANQNMLKAGGVILGQTYPRPIADLKTSRARALDAYKKL